MALVSRLAVARTSAGCLGRRAALSSSSSPRQVCLVRGSSSGINGHPQLSTVRVACGRPGASRASARAASSTTKEEVSTASDGIDASAGASAFRRHERVAGIVGKDGGMSRVGDKVQLRGWVRTVRAQKDISFVAINDGSSLSGIQAVITADGCEGSQLVADGELHTGAAVIVEGVVVESPGGKQKVEVKAESVKVLGTADPSTYPLQKKRHTLEFLRGIAHLRPRTNTIGAVTRVRNQLAYATHTFFQQHGFQYVNTPIVTASDCEGAGEQFQVTTLLNAVDAAASAEASVPVAGSAEDVAAAKAAAAEQGATVKALKDAKKAGDATKEEVDAAVAKLLDLKAAAEALENPSTPAAAAKEVPRDGEGKVDYTQDFFGKPSYLTVSGQLNAEIYATAMRDVYTFGPTFRAENSNTSRHLAEFWMVEPELAFADLQDDMDCAEAYLKHCLLHVLEHCDEDLEFFEKNIAKDNLRERLRSVATQQFARITYTEAVEHVLAADKKFEFPVEWGCDLQSEHERYLTEEVFKNTPVIVRDYPKAVKAFYMRENEDGKTVAAMDVLVPKVGELMGGSQREERLDVLERRIEEVGLEKESYWWYLDLRRYGSVPHAGFGLGFERLVQYVTGVENIRDVIPFPRYPNSAEF